MARPALALVLLALLAGGCGGDDAEPVASSPAPAPSTEATPEAGATPTATTEDERAREPADEEEPSSRRDSEEDRRAEKEERRDAPARAEERSKPAPEETGAPAEQRRAQEERAQAEQLLEQAKSAVAEAIELIDAADPGVCRRFFTQRYAEKVSGRRGDAAFAKCESDIASSQEDIRLGPFGPSRIRGPRAWVKFNLRVNGQLTDEEWRLLLADGRWRVDGSR